MLSSGSRAARGVVSRLGRCGGCAASGGSSSTCSRYSASFVSLPQQPLMRAAVRAASSVAYTEQREQRLFLHLRGAAVEGIAAPGQAISGSSIAFVNSIPHQRFQKRGLSVGTTTSAAYRGFTPVTLHHKGGSYHLSLALPADDGTTLTQTDFAFKPNTSVQGLRRALEDEGAEAVLKGRDGRVLEDNVALTELVGMGFRIEIAGRPEMRVTATHGPVYGDEDKNAEGHTELPALLEKSKVIQLRDVLSGMKRRSISHAEFVAMCSSCGIGTTAAERVLADLQRVGVVLHFSKDEQLSKTVFLRPEEAIEGFFSRYDMDSPLLRHLKRKAADAEAEAADLRRELDPLNKVKMLCDRQASAYSGRVMWLLSGTVVGGTGFYWWLSYVYFSWDIMEPVTFFTGLGVSTIGYAWWMFTNKSYEYHNIYDYFREKNRFKRYRDAGLDVEALRVLREEYEATTERSERLNQRVFHLNCLGGKMQLEE